MTMHDLFQALVAIEALSLLVGAWSLVDAIHQVNESRRRTRQ